MGALAGRENSEFYQGFPGPLAGVRVLEATIKWAARCAVEPSAILVPTSSRSRYRAARSGAGYRRLFP
jgi:hypothetical protein